MKAKIEAGAEINFVTKDEVRDVLRSWANELTRGARLIRRSIQGIVPTGGILEMSDGVGPAEGMVWGITRMSVAPGPVLPQDGLSVYVNTVESPSAMLIRSLSTDIFPDARGAMIGNGDTLHIVSNGSMVVGEQVTVTMTIREVPALMAWSM